MDPLEREEQIARLLKDVLADAPLWQLIDSRLADASQRQTLVSRAVQLYLAGAPTGAEKVTGLSSPVDYAAGLLRDVGDACALSSNVWSAGLPAVELPRRLELETAVRDLGPGEWAAKLGIALAVDLQALDGSEWPPNDRDVLDEPLPAGELARDWERGVKILSSIIELRERDPEMKASGWVKARADIANLIALARGWVLWARQSDEPAALVVAGSQLLAVQGAYVLTHSRGMKNSSLFDARVQKQILSQADAMRWLGEHEIDAPVWLDAY